MPVSGLVPVLPSRAWAVLGGEVVSAGGSGATVPYLFVYLHAVCRLPLAAVGVLLTLRAVLAVAGAVLGGVAADRFGAKRTAVAALGAAAAGTWMLAGARGLVTAVVGLVCYALACTVMAPALSALVASTVPADRRQEVFAWRYAALNLAAALGGGLAAVVLGLSSTSTGLMVLYIVDGISFAVCALLIGLVARRDRALPEQSPKQRGTGYRMVAADPAARWVCVVVLLVVAAGYAQLQVGIPGFMTAAGLDTRSLGWITAANMAAVVVLQVPMQRLSAHWRRSRSLLAAVAVMGCAWMLVQSAGGASVWVLVAAGVVFAWGETLFAPVVLALVNDLAPPQARGRYNGARGLAWTGGFLAGVAGCGTVLSAGGARWLFAALIGILALAALAVLRLERVLPGRLNHVPQPSPDETVEVAA